MVMDSSNNTSTTSNNTETTTTTTATSDCSSSSNHPLPSKHNKLHVVFLHLDLGIGGAEQLVTQLALVSAELGHDVDIVTTRCNADHCFAPYKPDSGCLYSSLHIWGRWIPADCFGLGRTFFSTIRLLYLALCIARKKSPDLIVLDVLPTPLALLRVFTHSANLYYCHFPDYLLKQQQQQQQQSTTNSQGIATRLYRSVMDRLEAWTMLSADVVCVNSIYTRETVQSSFPSLQGTDLPVLYPAFDGTSMDEYRTHHGSSVDKFRTSKGTVKSNTNMLLSLNRYERKKNLELFLHAMDWIRQHSPETKLPRIVIAGGYDVHSVENVEYRSELGALANELQLADHVEFLQSISDATRAALLHQATAVVYTPSLEHFGIVPLEAMYAETAVVACANGGPKESIVDGTTGFLCQENTPACFGAALLKLLQDPELAATMGRAGRKHVVDAFGQARLAREWKRLVETALVKGRQRRLRRRGQYRLARTILYSGEAILTLCVAMLVTFALRHLGLLEQSEYVWDGVRKLVNQYRNIRGDEL